jgi:hypothetical protein
MAHLTPKNTSRDFPLSGPQWLELELGQKETSAFRDDAELREAWEANRAEIIRRYAFRLHNAGWRPLAFWYFEAGEPSLVDDGFDADSPKEAERLTWLYANNKFVPGELAAMRRRSMSDPDGYAATAWRLILDLQAEVAP